jgi:hypothetical protein
MNAYTKMSVTSLTGQHLRPGKPEKREIAQIRRSIEKSKEYNYIYP